MTKDILFMILMKNAVETNDEERKEKSKQIHTQHKHTISAGPSHQTEHRPWWDIDAHENRTENDETLWEAI